MTNLYNNDNTEETLNKFNYLDLDDTTKTIATSLEYNPDFEYDEDYNSLIADKDLEDSDFELGLVDPFDDLFDSPFNQENSQERKIGNGNLTSENLIDEDFEAELGANINSIIQSDDIEDEKERRRKELQDKIDSYRIVNVCGADNAGRTVIILAACNLPTKDDIEKEKEFFKNQDQFFDLLLEGLKSILDGFVEADYTLVYFHHGLKSSNKPSYQFLVRVYQILDRKYKKNLKALYLVHPSYLIKIFWKIFKQFISVKFSKKVTYCNSLSELKEHMDIKTLPIPKQVLDYDVAQFGTNVLNEVSNVTYSKHQQFKVPLEHIIQSNNGNPIPPIVYQTIEFIKKEGMNEEGIFRKSGTSDKVKKYRKLINDGELIEFESNDIHVATGLLKMFFRELQEPLLTFKLYDEIMTLQGTLDTSDKVEVIRDLITKRLPDANYILLKYIIEFLAMAAQNSDITKMDARNLAVVFGTNFLWSQTDYGTKHVNNIINVTELLIRFHSDIFTKDS